ncbi:MAG: tRNA uridine-5-carboxymethylaminomethyl(34) synthesis GTPase MnmE [Rickettsiales bacterium]|jgi:tRNA modification GTPase|nr:tRNA uridine-5-carboxymethylaminomethyl(34) synthesis GTPase MnmE [Rickettsiales bacterium]
MNDAIFALSSGAGKSGVAVIRVSGPDLRDFFSEIINHKSEIINRHAYFANLWDIDRGIVIYFSAPNSFTGQDVVELHSHGSPAVVSAIYEKLKSFGLRMAAPGEFARRAFDNGKMDLAETDGLIALLDARTDRQRAAALRSMIGGDSAAYENWRARMIEISAYAAAILDYPSDELPENILETLRARTQELYDEITRALSLYAAARAVRSGFNIVLAGETNTGKSSLFNRLVGQSRAIVSDIAGTTRDVITASLDIDGYLVNLSDTAGLRETTDAVERIGIEKTNAEIENADLILRVCTGSEKLKVKSENNEIFVLNKSDTLNLKPQTSNLCVSAMTGDGIPELLNVIKQKIHESLDGAESEISLNARTKFLLEAAAEQLRSALSADAPEIFAEFIGRAADAIGQILGVIGTEEILDATFSQLCLGK